MQFPRASGILLHPTSLPARGGIGDLGPAAHEFIDFLAAAGQSLWQILPLGPPGMGDSPYSATSAFAGNPLLISLERLAERGWLAKEKLAALPGAAGAVDYAGARAAKMPLVREAARNFLQRAEGSARQRFEQFCERNREWLDDFALFSVLRERFQGKPWNEWPPELGQRNPQALGQARQQAAEPLALEHAIQFFFFEQWGAARAACRERGIQIVGDVAIFVSHDSADVWTHPEIFYLLPDGRPEFVAGVPPDGFSETGQRWGNPVYRWDALKARGYDWWVARMRAALGACDIVRLDHFRGFEQYWQIPASEPTAVHGRWMPGPGDDLFNALRAKLGDLPFIAEDLGFITPEVHALRDRLRIPGMRVMQFGFGDAGAHVYLPHRFSENVVVYTGTHDNDTTLGWWRKWAAEHERKAAREYLGICDEKEVAWAFIRGAECSVAEMCIVPLQDVLGLGSEARMNIPSRADGNWAWRYESGALTPELAARLRGITELSDRISTKDQQGQGEIGENFAA